MSIEIQYEDDVLGFHANVRGSDSRLNVSSRADSRGYYNSRDKEQTFATTFEHPASSAGQYSFYLQNTSNTKTFVLSHIGLNSDLGANVKLCRVTGTPAGGTTITPTNENLSSSKAAEGVALEDGGGTAITGLTQINALDYVKIPVDGHAEMRTGDRTRISQNEAIALEVSLATSGTPLVFGTVFGYFE